MTLRTRYPTQPDPQMQTEQTTYTSYPQLDGEESATESLCQNYSLPKPVAVEDLSMDDREILESVCAIPTGSPLVLRVRVVDRVN